MVHSESYSLSGETVKLKDGQVIEIEDYADRVIGCSWMMAKGLPIAIEYGYRVLKSDLPFDDEVLYGKIDFHGKLVHVSELQLEPKDYRMERIKMADGVHGEMSKYLETHSIFELMEIVTDVIAEKEM